MSQQSISSFFKRQPQAKRTPDDDDVVAIEPPTKRPRPEPTGPRKTATSSYFGQPKPKPAPPPPAHVVPTQLASFRLPAQTPSAAPSGSAFGSYTLEQADPGPSTPRQRTEEQNQRRQAWEKRMEGGLIRRRRSLALDEAAAAEARQEIADEDNEVESGSEPEDRKAAAAKLVAKYAAGETKKGKKKEEVGPSGQTFTPLEKQYIEIKRENTDVLLLMEVGYKYKFHGDDAKAAARELGIAAFPQRNFYTASIPTHRLHIHVKKLISLGYKVGVISQTETAALKKAGENRNAPFTRELTHLFTAATYVEDASLGSSTIRDDPVVPGSAPPSTNALVAIVEQGMGGMAYDDRVRIGLVSVVPITGEVVWDEFDDAHVRTELETRLAHMQPAELLLPTALSKATEKVIAHFASGVRIERVEARDYNTASKELTNFYKDKDAVLAMVDFPKQVVVALSVAVDYMKGFKLQDAFRHRSSFTRFTNRAHMLLSSNTLTNLEVYANADGGLYGSLLWLRTCSPRLTSTKTRMGRRLLREWIGRPLLDVGALQSRVDAVQDIIDNTTYHVEKLRGLLVNMPDLVRGLTRIQYGKAEPSELATILIGLARVGSEFRKTEGAVFRSALLNDILRTLPTIADTARAFLAAINVKAARDGNMAGLWSDSEKYPELQDAQDCIGICQSELDEHLHEIRKTLRRPSLQYVTVAGIEYLIEVPVREAKSTPPRWVKVQSTKNVVRFHTPEVLRIMTEREQHKETLNLAAKRAFLAFQADIAECHNLVVVAKQLAVIDCLVSLATVAQASGYTKPTFVADPVLQIKQGRHPMVEMLRDEPYVPFDIDFDTVSRTKVITGPNMAGKSSCVRATALIVCMAQIGSFVPATAVTLGIHDAVQTRMGASDDIGRGKSTFMVELSETSDILRTLTPRSLVILDELGRGTSTYDGVAIAYATLAHVAQAGCSTLFVTHYPTVAEQLAREYPERISNWHMAFDETTTNGYKEITFLYRLTSGLAEASFGVWCARLAGLPEHVLRRAEERAGVLRQETRERGERAMRGRVARLMRAVKSGEGEGALEVARLLLRG